MQFCHIRDGLCAVFLGILHIVAWAWVQNRYIWDGSLCCLLRQFYTMLHGLILLDAELNCLLCYLCLFLGRLTAACMP